MAGKMILQDGTEIVHMGRPQDKVHLRILFLKVLAPLLGHAACYTQDHVRIFTLQALHFSDLPQDLLFRVFTNAACIDDNDISMFIVLTGFVAQIKELTSIVFAVAFIHLASIIDDGVSLIHIILLCQSNNILYCKIEEFCRDL